MSTVAKIIGFVAWGIITFLLGIATCFWVNSHRMPQKSLYPVAILYDDDATNKQELLILKQKLEEVRNQLHSMGFTNKELTSRFEVYVDHTKRMK